jgi:ABC-type branched-subunit amino acid transport system substrate-binding protein
VTGCSEDSDGTSSTPAPTGPAKIGILINEDIADAAQGAGASVETGNTRHQAQAVVDDINSRGGLGGRRVEAVYQIYKDTSAEDQYALACTAFTQDSKVEAVLNSVVGADPTLIDCLAKAGIPLIGVGGLLLDADDYKEFPDYVYAPTSLNATRLASEWVELLRDEDYFGTAPKIGVIHDGTASTQRALAQSLRPALQQAGFSVTAEAAPRGPEQAPNAVLQLKNKKVDHVLFFTSSAGTVAFFAKVAEEQKYRPRYAVTSYVTPGVLQGYMPPQQLSGAIGMGWTPIADVDSSHQPTPTEAMKHCREIMVRAGEDMSKSTAATFATGYCDTGFFLEQLAKKSKGALSAAALQKAAASLGTGFEPAAALGAKFGSHRYDGVGVVRTLTWGGSCSCFEYTGEPRTLD